MNDRVLRHQASFFDYEEEANQFWNALFKVLNQRDFELGIYVLASTEDNQAGKEFKIAKLCSGCINVISLNNHQHYICIGRLPDLNVANLYEWVLMKVDGQDSDNTNRFVSLESFLRFNFNRRSSNAMMNGMFAFLYRYKDELISKNEKLGTTALEITDHCILECCLSLMVYMRDKVLPLFIPVEDINSMTEANIGAFPYVYSFEVKETLNLLGNGVSLPGLITVSSYTYLPESIVYTSVHREINHIVRDFLGRDRNSGYIDSMFKEDPVYECLNLQGNVVYSANFTKKNDVSYSVKPWCFERKVPEHTCYLFDGLDVLSAINLTVNSDPNTADGLLVDLNLSPARVDWGNPPIVAHLAGRITSDGFVRDRFKVDDQENLWVLYSAEIEAMVALYVEDLTDNEGMELEDVVDTIYIDERNIILSRAEILNSPLNS